MMTKFDRLQIASVNNAYSGGINKSSRRRINSKETTVPEKEIFKYVFENAKKGNEMAAVLLDEWQKTCKPKDGKEEQVIDLINKAADKIFK